MGCPLENSSIENKLDINVEITRFELRSLHFVCVSYWYLVYLQQQQKTNIIINHLSCLILIKLPSKIYHVAKRTKHSNHISVSSWKTFSVFFLSKFQENILFRTSTILRYGRFKKSKRTKSFWWNKTWC
jgi:hypothetical protein